MSSKSDRVYSVTGRGGGRDSRDRRGNCISELTADRCKMSEMFKHRVQTPPRPNCGLLWPNPYCHSDGCLISGQQCHLL